PPSSPRPPPPYPTLFRSPDDRAVGPHPHQRGVGGDPVAAEGGEVADGLDQVRLALAVGTDEGRHPRVERDLDPGVGPEIGQRQVRDVHGRSPTSPGAVGRRAALWMTASPVDYFFSTA